VTWLNVSQVSGGQQTGNSRHLRQFSVQNAHISLNSFTLVHVVERQRQLCIACTDVAMLSESKS